MIPGEAARRPRILVTRAAGQASALADELRRLGADPILVPVIEIVPPDSYDGLDLAIAELRSFDWIVFTSANAVSALANRAQHLQMSLLPLAAKIGAIGAVTARALETIGLVPHIVPSAAIAESLTDSLLPFARRSDGNPARFLMVRAQEGRELLPQGLRRAGAYVAVAAAYKTILSQEGAKALRVHLTETHRAPEGVTLTSSSTARNFFALLSAEKLLLPENFAVASIGPITSQTLVELGHPPHVEAQEATVLSLAEATMRYLAGAKRSN